MKKALITDHFWPDIEIESEMLRAAGVEPFAAPDASEETLARLAPDADVILFCFANVTGAVLRAAGRCVAACRFGIGVDNIDLPAATAAGIVVTNVPDYCMDEVGDPAISMILALNRRFVPHDRSVKAGGWSSVALDQPMHRTRGAILGIVGFGRIGRSVAAKKLRRFDPGRRTDGEQQVQPQHARCEPRTRSANGTSCPGSSNL